jgi:hypothetical protein
MKHASNTVSATLDIFLKHLDETFAIQLKHSKHTYETLQKTPCSIQLKTFATCLENK